MRVFRQFIVAGGAVIAFAAGSVGTALAANLVSNPSFESPVAPPNHFLSTTPSGWVPVGQGVDLIRAGYSGAVPSAGNEFVDLVGVNIGGPNVSGLEQGLMLTAGIPYLVSFDYSSDTIPDDELDASLGTLFSVSLSTAGMNAFANFGPVTPWATYSTTVTPSVSGVYSLRFTTATGYFGGPYVDNVMVESMAVVPEPGTWWVGGVLALLGGLRLVREGRRTERV